VKHAPRLAEIPLLRGRLRLASSAWQDVAVECYAGSNSPAPSSSLLGDGFANCSLHGLIDGLSVEQYTTNVFGLPVTVKGG
jgi:hypothetical protein